MDIKLSLDNVYKFITKDIIFANEEKLINNIKKLHNRTGKGCEYLGWHDLPSSISDKDIKNISDVAADLRGKSDIIVVVGIGGSYLGARAVIEALSDSFSFFKPQKPAILYAGYNLCEDYHSELLKLLNDTDFSVIVISKSGTTTEPAIAFRLLKELLEKKYGEKKASERVVAITDSTKGALKILSNSANYRTFVIPNDIGGRYSVLTPVGLLPVAAAGFDITEIIKGAKNQEKILRSENIEKNNALKYAAARYALFNNDKSIEILVNYHSKLSFFAEWWKQLFGESEGKQNGGIFPASVNYTTDLHSLGQYVQEGKRNLFETIISVENLSGSLTIPADEKNIDNINYLSGMRVSNVNKKAEIATSMAHIDGGVPVIDLSIQELNLYNLGQLIYFFEKSCAISGYLLDINPFNQPGVENYKDNMFALLGKPGYEKFAKKINK